MFKVVEGDEYGVMVLWCCGAVVSAMAEVPTGHPDEARGQPVKHYFCKVVHLVLHSTFQVTAKSSQLEK